MNESEAIRSDIEMTRRRMDDTMAALGERFHGRHLLDEVIGFFRGNHGDSGSGADVREKISHSASTAANTVMNTVKKNPLPILLLTAGAAWLTYSAMKSRGESDKESLDAEDRYDPSTHFDRPLEYPESGASSPGSKFQQMKDRAAETADEYPLQVGLGCLAAGVLIGLAVPTPEPVHRVAGRAVDRLRERTRAAGRTMLEKGKHVARAATDAAKHEAELQGLTLDRLRSGGRAVAESAETAPANEAQSEGAAPAAGDRARRNNERADTVPTDPSAAGPST